MKYTPAPAPNPAMDPIQAAMLCYHVYGFRDAVLPDNWSVVPIDNKMLPNFADISLEMDLTVFTGFGAVFSGKTANLSMEQCMSYGPVANLYCETINGKVVRYAYTTRGSLSATDWVNNGLQLVGSAPHFVLDTFIAMQLSERCEQLKIPLVLLGHSKSGGHAALSSLVTGRPAVTFNASGLSDVTKSSILKHLKLEKFKGDGNNVIAYCNFFDPLVPGRARIKGGKLQPPDGHVYILLDNTELNKALSFLKHPVDVTIVPGNDDPFLDKTNDPAFADLPPLLALEEVPDFKNNNNKSNNNANIVVSATNAKGQTTTVLAQTSTHKASITNKGPHNNIPLIDEPYDEDDDAAYLTPSPWAAVGEWLSQSMASLTVSLTAASTTTAETVSVAFAEGGTLSPVTTTVNNTLTNVSTSVSQAFDKDGSLAGVTQAYTTTATALTTASVAIGETSVVVGEKLVTAGQTLGEVGTTVGGALQVAGSGVASALTDVANAAIMAKLTWDSHMLPHMIAKLKLFKEQPHIICAYEGNDDGMGDSFQSFATNTMNSLMAAKDHFQTGDVKFQTYIIKRH